MPLIVLDAGFADLVFHVLAHVDLPGLPCNLFNPTYVAWVESHLGRAEQRELARDSASLQLLLADAHSCACVQNLAFLFRDIEHAQHLAGRELSDLQANDVADAGALAVLQTTGGVAELLRCAAHLEGSSYLSLPAPLRSSAESLQHALDAATQFAPRLAACELHACRALTLHGRMSGSRIYIGIPNQALGVSAEHVACQAAHEATLREVLDAAAQHGLQLHERRSEATAVVTLAIRARAHGQHEQHARWAAVWGITDAHCAVASLAPAEQALAGQLLA